MQYFTLKSRYFAIGMLVRHSVVYNTLYTVYGYSLYRTGKIVLFEAKHIFSW